MSFETYLVPVSIDNGYRYDLRKTGRMVGTAMLKDGLWVATPYEQIRDSMLIAIPQKTTTFKRLAGAEYYLLAIVFDGDADLALGDVFMREIVFDGDDYF